ncbi:hypothetical protein [Legionella fallonii]|nr:hypothetical protein [Legionella fallonii]
MKKSKRNNNQSGKKISPDKLSNISGGNRVHEGFDRMRPRDPQTIIDTLRNRRT